MRKRGRADISNKQLSRLVLEALFALPLRAQPARAKREERLLARAKREERLLAHGCESHRSAVALAALVEYVKHLTLLLYTDNVN